MPAPALRLPLSVAALLCLFLTTPALALEFRVSGIGGELRRNVLAYLAALPAEVATAELAEELVRERVSDALRAVGFYRPELQVTVENGRGNGAAPRRVSVNVRAGDPVRLREVELRVEGAAAQDAAFTDFLRREPLRRGEPLHHGSYSEVKRQLQSLGQQRGYFEGRLVAHAVRVDPDAGAADVTLHYLSGPRYRFGTVSGDEAQLSASSLEALLPFAPGDPYDQALLRELRSRLQATGFFAGVSVVPDIDAARQLAVPVTVELEPAPRHSFEVGVGYSTDIRERISLVWRSPRLNRRGHSQETRLQWSPVNPGGTATYRIPLGERLRNNVQLQARREDNEFGDLRSEQHEAGLLFESAAGAWVRAASLRALGEKWTIADGNFEGDYLLAGLTLSRRDRRGDVVDPVAGFSQFYSLEGGAAAAGSDSDLLRAYASWRAVLTPAAGHRLVGRFELGALFGADLPPQDLPPSLGFFAGGDQSIRGFAYQSIGNEILYRRAEEVIPDFTLGGDRLVTGSLEYQHYLGERWRVALFADAGDAFDEGHFDLNVGLGAGVHYLTPIGAIKFELANSVSDDDPAWRIHFNIGAEL
jgi:translocation and assembly module TamA